MYSGNEGYSGGAVYNSGSFSGSAGEFAGNSASVYGGAIYNSGVLQVSDAVFSGNTAAGQANDIHNEGIFSFGSDGVTHVATVLNGGVSGSGEMYLNQGTLTLAQGSQIHQNTFQAAAGTVTYVTLNDNHLVQASGVSRFGELDDGVRDGQDKALDTIGNDGFAIHPVAA